MFELCRLLAAKKTTKRIARAPRSKPAKAGATVEIFGRPYVLLRRDDRFANAWFVSKDGVQSPHSFSRDMMTVR